MTVAARMLDAGLPLPGGKVAPKVRQGRFKSMLPHSASSPMFNSSHSPLGLNALTLLVQVCQQLVISFVEEVAGQASQACVNVPGDRGEAC